MLLAATAVGAFWYGGWRAEQRRLELLDRQPVIIDLARAKLPPGCAPVIDGRNDEQKKEWAQAVLVPWENGVESRFAWDGQALYGHVRGYNGLTTPWGEVRILVWSKGRCVRLEPLTPWAVTAILREGTSGRAIMLPEGAVESRGVLQPHAQGDSWEFEFRLPWAVLGVSSPEHEYVSAEVFRMPRAPVGYMVEMRPDGGKNR
jgi:hypothetical protein